LFVVFLLYPIFNVFHFSFQHYNPGAFYGNRPAGWENFINIFTKDVRFLNSFLISLRWITTQVSLQLLFGLLIALLLNRPFFCRGLIRSIVITPWAIGGVIVAP
jgi:multiple sugar transport system permease protein